MSNERVSIQYSIPMKELPEEVRRLISKVNTELELLKEVELWQRDILSMAMFYNIDEIRHRLAAIDSMCEDINAIIQGYVSHREQEKKGQASVGSIDEITT